MHEVRRSLILTGAMLGVAGLAAAARHRAQQGRTAEPPQLDTNIPKQFASWQLMPTPAAIVNPQTQKILDSLYSEIVSRTYFNASRYHVMLSVAYGNDQRGGLEAHKPEVCYPAQGFTLTHQQDGNLATRYGPLQVRQLRTALGQRVEPVTYWFSMANTINATEFDKRLARLRTMMTGSIPDGILLRVSSIDTDLPRAYAMHAAFIGDLLEAMPGSTRDRVLGRVAM